jgi:SAM-dependent methyltransferase
MGFRNQGRTPVSLDSPVQGGQTGKADMSDNEQEEQRTSWNDFYLRHPDPENDPWPAEYARHLPKNQRFRVLDIGCGSGSHFPWYLNQGWQVTAFDYSSSAVDLVRSRYPSVDARVLDLRRPLPFDPGEFHLLVADLCLHYFHWELTRSIIAELRRVAATDAVLLGRVNSVNDTRYGSGRGREIEPGFFDYRGRLKRFFTREMVPDMLAGCFRLEGQCEKELTRYGGGKWVWEFCANA